MHEKRMRPPMNGNGGRGNQYGNNGGNCVNLFKNANQGNNIFGKASQPLIVYDNPFKELSNKQQQREQQRNSANKPSVRDIFSSIIFPCCQSTPLISSDYRLADQSILYTMPCNHTICRQCIKMILSQTNHHDFNEQIFGCKIFFMYEGSDPQCDYTYTSQMAQNIFPENKLVKNWMQKLLHIVKQQEKQRKIKIHETQERKKTAKKDRGFILVDKDEEKRRPQNLFKERNMLRPSKSASNLFTIHKVHYNCEDQEQKNIHYKPQPMQLQDDNALEDTLNKRNINNNYNKSLIKNIFQNTSNKNLFQNENRNEHNIESSSSQNSSQEPATYNPCAYEFCHKQIIGFYCSSKCESLDSQLESVKYEVEKVIVNGNQ